MSEAIDILRHDHDAILMALSILDRIAEEARHGEVSSTDAQAFLGFLREFADKCHHGKEEGLLFPALVAAGLPEQGGPVGQMLLEHGQGRDLVAAMSRSSESAIEPEAFADAAKAYSAHLRSHINKENTVLFPMAETMLDTSVLETLREGFEQHEEMVIGHGRHEQLHEMLKALKAKYLG